MTDRHDEVVSRSLTPAQSARRQRIIDAASALLTSYPYEQIQMRDVVKAAGVALGTLYRYFSSKEHLYAVVITSWVGPTPEQLDPRSDAAVERLRAKLHYVAAAYERRPNFYAALITLASTTDPAVREQLSAWTDRANVWLLEELAPLGEQHASDVAQMLLAIHGSTMTRAVLHGGSFLEAVRVIDAFIDIVARELAEVEGETPRQPSANSI